MGHYREDVADVAYAAAIAAERGHDTYRPFGDAELMDLRTTGYCTRFVRQCHEAALQLPPFSWSFAAPDARAMEARLKGAGKRTRQPRPGDIVAMNSTSYQHGHIGIYLGVLPQHGEEEFIAHNTSVRRGGRWGPGTCLTPLSLVSKTVSGYYATLPSRPEAKPARVTVMLDGAPVDCNPRLEGERTRVDLRPLMEALGVSVDTSAWPTITLVRPR